MSNNNSKIFLIMLYKPSEIKVPPFPLMYLSSSLKKEGYNVQVIHCEPSQMDTYIQEIIKTDPLLVGFSVLTGPPILYSLEMSRKIKDKNRDIPIVWGGVHPSLLPKQCLEEDSIDVVAIGEGEQTVIELAHIFHKKKSFKNISGIGYKENKRIIINKARLPINNLDEYGLDFECVNLTNYVSERKRQNKKIRTLGYYSSRGCPHNCGFCYNQQFHQRRWRAQSANKTMKDVLYLKKKYNLNEIQFWDDNFFTDKKRAFKILQKTNMFVNAEVRIDYINEEFAKKLKELNISYLLIGAESGSNRILNLINKNFDVDKILSTAKILNKYSINAQYSFILGLPTETKDELDQTIGLMLKIKAIHKQASFTVGMYLPYPGTEMFDLALKEGFSVPTKTKHWYQIDRWTNTVQLPWINNRLCLNTRHLFAMLNWKFPINFWSKLRLRMRWLNFSQDLRLIIFLNLFKQKYFKK